MCTFTHVMSTLTKAQHTTAPWIVESGKEFSGDNWLVCSCGRSKSDDLKYWVTTDSVHASELTGDAKADAYLIAAAPNLLQAAKYFVKWVNDVWASAALGDKTIAEYECARAAIRRADLEQIAKDSQ